MCKFQQRRPKAKLKKMVDRARRELKDDTQVDIIESSLSTIFDDEQLLLFLHAPPGAGKTRIANEITRCLSELNYNTTNTAITGTAATHLPNGCTLSHLLAVAGFGEKITWKNVIIISEDQAQKVLTRLGRNTRLLIIDEISMCSARFLALADIILRAVLKNDLPFGGFNVIIMGDFDQMKPIKSKSLYQSAI